MSVVIYVKVSEGIVIAADSMSIVLGGIQTPDGKATEGILKTFEHAKKVSHLSSYPIGTLTWGIAQVGLRTTESLIKEFETTPDCQVDDYNVGDLANKLYAFMKSRYDTATKDIADVKNKPALGMIICGFSKGKYFAEDYRFILPLDDKPKILRQDLPDDNPNFGANWYGLTEPIVRFFLGYDPRLRNILEANGLAPEKVKGIISGFQYPVIFPAMPLQDAIDFASFLVELCIWRNRFVIGAPQVGGNVDVAVITHDGFDWVSRKEWQPVRGNRRKDLYERII